jgi:hypothetical protein
MTSPLAGAGPLATRRGILLATVAAIAVAAHPLPAIAMSRLPTLAINAHAPLAAGCPVTFGHAYEKGAVRRGEAITLTAPGAQPIVAQLDQVNRWSDGSLRFAAHSLRLPVAMSAGQVIHAQLGTMSAAPPSGGAVTAAALAAASDWKIKAHGFSYGPDTFTVSVNDVLAHFRDGRAGSKEFGGSNPLGGWELVRSGPVCTLYKAWRYLKRDSDGASHPWVKVVLYLACYPDGRGGLDYEVLPEVRQSNAYGPHPAATVSITDATKQRAYGGIYELWNGPTLVRSWGGAADPNTLTLNPGDVHPAMGKISSTAMDPNRLKSTALTLQGANLPQPLTGVFAFMSSGGHLYFGRKDAFENSGQNAAAWQAGKALGAYTDVRANGCIWTNLTTGTTGSAAPTPANPQGGTVTTPDGIKWFQKTVAFSERQPAHFKLAPVIVTMPGSAAPLVPPDAAPVWQGMAGRETLVIGHDPNYLLQRSRAVTPVDPGAPVPSYPPAFAPPYRPNFQYLFTGRGSWNATADTPDDECIGWLGLSPANLALNPLDPVCERAVRNLSYGLSDFQINWDDHRTGRPAHGGTKPWPGFIPNPEVNFYPARPGGGSPAWPGIDEFDNWYQGSYGPLVDSSHMPSPFIMPYLRSAHPFFIDQALSQSLALNNSLNSANRNPVDSRGVRRDYNFLYYWNGGIDVRVQAWALRHHGTLDFLMPDDDPARPLVRDMMDGVGTYAGIFESEMSGGHIPGRSANPSFNALGLLYCTDRESVTDPVNHMGGQAIHCFMYAHFATALSMEEWRGERAGFKAMNDALSRYYAGAFDSRTGGSTYFLNDYAIGAQDAKGQPAYPDWRTLWARNKLNFSNPGGPPPATGASEDPDWNAGRGGMHGVGDTGTIFLGAIAMRASCGDARALRVWEDGIRRSRTAPFSGISFVGPGSGFYSGHPLCSATYAVVPVREA